MTGHRSRRAMIAGVVLVLVVGCVAAIQYGSEIRLAVWKASLIPSQRPAALGDGGAAVDLLLCDPMGLAVDAAGSVYVSDRGRAARGRIVWRIDPQGIAHAVAGTGRRGKARAGSSRRLSFSMPEGIAFDDAGRLHIVDAGNHMILRVDGSGRVERIAGTGTAGDSGDGGPAAEARLNRPSDIRFDSRGFFYVADVENHRIRRVDPDGRIHTVAGTGTPGYRGDGGPAVAAQLNMPWGIAVDYQDRLLIADSENNRIRRVEHDGTIRTIAGTGERGRSDGGPYHPREVMFDVPQGLWEAEDGILYISDEHNHMVWALEDDETLIRVLGTGRAGAATEGAAALQSPLNDPEGLLTLPDGSLLVAEGDNGRVVRVMSDGRIQTFAGRGDTDSCVA